jgi:hypothetical protein
VNFNRKRTGFDVRVLPFFASICKCYLEVKVVFFIMEIVISKTTKIRMSKNSHPF